jgi:hypothetical protein
MNPTVSKPWMAAESPFSRGDSRSSERFRMKLSNFVLGAAAIGLTASMTTAPASASTQIMSAPVNVTSVQKQTASNTVVENSIVTSDGVEAASSICKNLPSPLSVTKTLQWCANGSVVDDGLCTKNTPVVRKLSKGRAAFIFDCNKAALGIRGPFPDNAFIGPYSMVVTTHKVGSKTIISKGGKVKVTSLANTTDLVRLTATRPAHYGMNAIELSKPIVPISKLTYSLSEAGGRTQAVGSSKWKSDHKPIAKVVNPKKGKRYITVKNIGTKARWSLALTENGRLRPLVKRKKQGWDGQTWYSGYKVAAVLVEAS